MQQLTATQLKDRAKLTMKRYRRETKQVIVEGERCLKQLAEAGVAPRELYLAPGAPQSHPILSLVQPDNTFEVKQSQLERLTRSKTPPPICALFDEIEHSLPQTGRFLYLDDVRDPGNLGAILRSALALGVDAVVLSPDSCELYNPKAIQSAMGAQFILQCVTREPAWAQLFRGQVLAAHMDGESIRNLAPPSGDTLMVIGGEAHGVNPTLLQRADTVVSIPLSGSMESLNAAVAAGIAMYWMMGE